jgi:hypothetical protein
VYCPGLSSFNIHRIAFSTALPRFLYSAITAKSAKYHNCLLLAVEHF